MRLLLCLCLAVAAAQARPRWADKPDSADASGHTFVCEGQGKSEEDALATAQGICGDKICKVCGVEVESIVETRETLKGVDLLRKVVERCRRVRKSDTKIRSKSSDCDPSGCSAWIEVFYSTEDEKEECPGFAREDFADPEACEKDIDLFRHLEGRTAEAFAKRTAALDAAIGHCAKIDVRPTPAMLALDEKLHAGMDQFEYTLKMQEKQGNYDRPFWGYYLATDPALRTSIDESKLLIERIHLIRDYVANKALVFAVIEAAQAKDLDSPTGLARFADALQRAPPGKQYGAPDIHFASLSAVYHFKSDTSAVSALLRRMYPPERLQDRALWDAALFFKDDGKVTQEEWDWAFKAHQANWCGECLRVLLEAPDHGTPEARIARLLAALPTMRARGKDADARNAEMLLGSHDPAFILAAEARLPEASRKAYRWSFLYRGLNNVDKASPEVKQAYLHRLAQALADGYDPAEARGYCTSLAGDLKSIEDRGGDTALLDARTCDCLTGALRSETSLVNRSDLLDHGKKRKLQCVRGLP